MTNNIENNEIVAINTTEFLRVDFDNPYTIMSYGADLLEEMNSFMKNVAIMTNQNSNTTTIDLDDCLKKINSFSNYLESDKGNNESKRGLLPKLGQTVKNAKEKFEEKILGKEVYTDSYADQYSKINEQIDAIEQAVEQKKNDTLELINIDNASIENMKKYSEKLSMLIKLGEEDLNNYKEKIEQLEKSNDEEDIEVRKGRQAIALFEKRIESLKKELVIIKNTILQGIEKRTVNMELVMEYSDYNNNTVHILRSQAESMITTKLQKDNIREQKRLNEITNNAIKQNSKTIVTNIEQANELRISGNIHMDTLQEITNNVKKGIDLIRNGNKALEDQRLKNVPIVDAMLQSFESLNSEIADVISEMYIEEPTQKSR